MGIVDGKPEYYKGIIIVIFLSFATNIGALIAFNVDLTEPWLIQILGRNEAFIFELFFWGALGATISSSLFLSEDKEINELEALKDNPDPAVLRYPDAIDVCLYVQRILTSGLLAVISAVILFAGLGYFEVDINNIATKQQMLFIITAFLVGMYQGNFIVFLSKLSKKMLQGRKDGS